MFSSNPELRQQFTQALPAMTQQVSTRNMQGFFQQFWEKAFGQNWEKMTDLTSKFGEINAIKHNKGSKIYPQNQVILDCIMPSIPLNPFTAVYNARNMPGEIRLI